jgi:hypothetical protein
MLWKDAGKDLDERRLSRAVVAEERQDAARVRAQRNIDERRRGAEGFRYVDRLHDRDRAVRDRLDLATRRMQFARASARGQPSR